MTYLNRSFRKACRPLVLAALGLTSTGWAASPSATASPGASAAPTASATASPGAPTAQAVSPRPRPSPTASATTAIPSPSPAARATPSVSPVPSPAPSVSDAVTYSGAPFSWSHVIFDRIDGDLVRFRTNNGAAAPKPVKTRLGDLHYFGLIRNDAGMPYFLFGGRSHKSSGGIIGDLNERGIQVIRPDRGRVAGFTFPGKILDPRSRALLHESRAFFGRCVNSRAGDVYVVFQRDRNDRRRSLQSSVYIAEPGADYLIEKLIERQRAPRIKDALARAKGKACVEIDGTNRIASRKTLNLNPHDSDDDAMAEGDDQETKENQTDQDLTPSED